MDRTDGFASALTRGRARKSATWQRRSLPSKPRWSEVCARRSHANLYILAIVIRTGDALLSA
jgi:cytochrome b561